ncbi:MAG TPA: heavy metal sensor histidine kinase [Candidatus Acidoferrum sp.]|jgi:heavy metal sensor kinase
MLDSVRARLTVWYTLALALVLILLAALTYVLYERNSSQRTDSNLVELADAFATTFNAEMEDQSSPEAVKDAAREAMIEHRFRDTIFVILGSDGNVLLSTLDLPAASPSPERIGPEVFASKPFRELAATAGSYPRGLRTIRAGRESFRGYARRVELAGRHYTLVVLQSLHPQHEMLEDVRDTFLWAIPIALVLASVGGYFLARKSLAPVAAMATQARGMGAANLHDRLAVLNPRDELGQLAVTFNQLLARLEESFERQKRFMADASHELRTPVAILHGETEVTLSRADRSPEEYRETLGILKDESQRLARIVEDLFTLTRADAGQYPLQLQSAYLDELAADVMRRARTLAMAKKITLSATIEPELPIEADEALLRRMLLNLLDNAIKYSPEGGQISLECRRQGDDYTLSVSDTGTGIPVELQTRIFERFFRADKARSRAEGDSGGAGLGLSIARWIAEAHHGRLELTKSDAKGTTFTAWLPVGDASK